MPVRKAAARICCCMAFCAGPPACRPSALRIGGSRWYETLPWRRNSPLSSSSTSATRVVPMASTRCVSVPIEARYSQVHGAPDFRPSHFRPLRDLWRITSHIVLQCVRRGGLWEVHKRVRQHPPVIDDPSGEFADAPSRPLAH